ncbi:MAG: hypothetical protein J6D28_00865 [Bacilli bacterium]|nr:hypothetical protein [Bacilli bacterium]
MFKKLKYLKKLKKETNDKNFIKKRNKIIQEIAKINKEPEEKIKRHYTQLEKKYLQKKTNNIKFLQEKKIVFNYHLYLLNKYYNNIYKDLFTKKPIK